MVEGHSDEEEFRSISLEIEIDVFLDVRLGLCIIRR
jgi:hypothetical protein